METIKKILMDKLNISHPYYEEIKNGEIVDIIKCEKNEQITIFPNGTYKKEIINTIQDEKK
jgi:hypothetical protein